MGVGADLRLDLIRDVGVLAQKFLHAVASLHAHVAVGVPRAGLVDEVELDAEVDDLADFGDALAVDDVEFGLLERGARPCS